MELTESQKAALAKVEAGLNSTAGEVYQGGYSTPNTKLRERNRKAVNRGCYKNEEYVSMREGIKKLSGKIFDGKEIDITDKEAFPVQESDFSWNKLAQKLGYSGAKAALKEADTSSSFVQFLRAGIQNITLAAYESVPVTYEDWVTVVASKLDTELYAPNQGVSFPREVPFSGKYPEVGAAALDIQLKNRKFGSMYVIEKELLSDDQTGSFQRQSALMGEYLRVLTEIWVYGKLQSVSSMKYLDLSIPTSETKPTSEANYPWTTSSAPFVGGGFNTVSPNVALSQANIQNGIIAMMEQLNLQGIRMNVTPRRLLISPHYTFDAAVLLHSAYYPSGAAAAGNTGGAFAINPIKGILDLSVSRYMPDQTGSFIADSKAWFIVDDSKPFFVHQLREGPVLEQENPSAGRSFDEDLVRWKARIRMNADFIDPRFAYRGSDGTV